MRKKTILLALPLILALASPAPADDHKALLAKCDIDRNGVINAPANNLPPQAWAMIEKEQVCNDEYDLDQLAKDIPDIRQRCDLNGNGRIDDTWTVVVPVLMAGRETNGKKAWRGLQEEVRKPVEAEKKCVTDASIAKGKEEIAKGKEEIAKGKEEIAKLNERIAKVRDNNNQMIQILVMLNPAEAKAYLAEAISKTEKALQQAKQNNKRDRAEMLEDELKILRERQKFLK